MPKPDLRPGHMTYLNVPIHEIKTKIPQATWRMLNKGEPTMPKTKTIKPKKLTLKEQLDVAHKRVYDANQRAEAIVSANRRQEGRIERLSTDIAWYKDTVRQMIAAMKRS